MNRVLVIAGLIAFMQYAGILNSRNVSGVVKSAEESVPLEGVKVAVKGSKACSGTQPDGAFYIDVSDKDSVLVFSLKGFTPKELTLTSSTNYQVQLERSPE